jgi:hypothetical protein
MDLTDPVKRILSYYESDNPGTKANLAQILLHGRLGDTGKPTRSSRSIRAETKLGSK